MGPALGEKVNPALSFTENEALEGQQSHPTMMTSEGCAVVSETEHEVTYPHPFLALPSSDIDGWALARGRGARHVPQRITMKRPMRTLRLPNLGSTIFPDPRESFRWQKYACVFHRDFDKGNAVPRRIEFQCTGEASALFVLKMSLNLGSTSVSLCFMRHV